MTPDALAILQQHIAGGSTSNALASLAGGDPQVAQLVSLLGEREKQQTAELDRLERDELDEDLHAREQVARQARAEALRRHLDELTDDVRRLQDAVDSIAQALGACPACLGRDEACLLCHGRGSPGSLPPEPSAFECFVLPAVRAHAYSRSRTGRGRTKPETPEGSAT